MATKRSEVVFEILRSVGLIGLMTTGVCASLPWFVAFALFYTCVMAWDARCKFMADHDWAEVVRIMVMPVALIVFCVLARRGGEPPLPWPSWEQWKLLF